MDAQPSERDGPWSQPPRRAFAIGVLRIEGGRIVETVALHETALFPAFGLPATLPADPADEG